MSYIRTKDGIYLGCVSYSAGYYLNVSDEYYVVTKDYKKTWWLKEDKSE